MTLKTFSGVGDLMLAPVDSAGTLTGPFKKAGNAHPLSVQVTTAQKKQVSRQRTTAGQTLATKTIIEETIGSLILRQWDPANLAYALSGEAVAMTGTSSSVSTEATTAALDGWVELSKRNISNLVLTGSGGTPTYVLNTDYEVNEALGMYKALTGGAIADAASLEADFDYAAESGYQVNIATSPLIRVAMRLDGTNEYTGERFLVTLNSVVLASSAEINFISDPDSEYEELPFTLSIESPDGLGPGNVQGI